MVKKKVKQSTKAVPIEKSMAMRYAHQVGGLKGKKLLKMFIGYSKSVIYKHCKKPLEGELKEDKRVGSGIGRPSKLSRNDRRNIKKLITETRESIGSFTSKRIQVSAGLEHVSNRTVRRAMNKHMYGYLHTRKKGVLSPDDIVLRLQWAKEKVRNKVNQTFWNYEVSLYLDGVGFEYKTNPFDQACAPKSREWRKRNEGLSYRCTAKGKKEGTTQARFMVAISYERGVVMCEQYDSIDGPTFAKMMDNCIPQAFALSINPHGNLFVQDGDPSQNSKVANEILLNYGLEIVTIPARSPDLNPIENFFNLAKKAVQEQARDKMIKSETFAEFSARVRDTIVNFDRKIISNLIGNMDKRIRAVIKCKGGRTKY